MDGLRVVERLRVASVFTGPIVMLMRAVARRGDRERCAELGVNAVVTRPFSQSEIFDALALALKRPAARAPPLRPRRPVTSLPPDDNAVDRAGAPAGRPGYSSGSRASFSSTSPTPERGCTKHWSDAIRWGSKPPRTGSKVRSVTFPRRAPPRRRRAWRHWPEPATSRAPPLAVR